MKNNIEFTRINNNIDGNPRYVCHFLNLLTEEERYADGFSSKYPMALKRARKIGGGKFHNKQYGGGIVFSCLEPNEIEERINKIVATT